MESHPYTKTGGVGPVTTRLTPGAEPASWKFAGAPDPWPCSPTCRAWSESSMPSFTDSTSTGAGCTCSPRNYYRATPSAFLHKQLDVTQGMYILRVLARLRYYHPLSLALNRPANGQAERRETVSFRCGNRWRRLPVPANR